MASPVQVERDAVTFVDDHRDALIDFAAALVAAPSPNPPGDERLVVDVACRELETLGLPAPTIRGRRSERPNVVCRLDGARPGKVLILNAHLDTKPVGKLAEWETDPFEPTIRDGELFGLGATDMKGAAAAIVYAAASMLPHRDDLGGSVLLVLSADEEAGGSDGAEFLVRECGLAADAALIGEPSGIDRPWERLYLGTRGLCNARVRVFGSQLHAGLADAVPAVNAAVKLAQLIIRFEERFEAHYRSRVPKAGALAVTPGVLVQGGVAPGVLPPWVEFLLDLRVPPGTAFEEVEAALNDFLLDAKRDDPSLDAKLTFEPPPLGWRQPLEISPDSPIVAALIEVSEEVLGFLPEFGIFPAWTDSLSFQGLGGIPTVPAFGPGLLGAAHKPNEYVPLDSILAASKIYALCALRFLSKGEEPSGSRRDQAGLGGGEERSRMRRPEK
jgi:acetylornithine deacetylase/succinyl-diaminopimelate desuccinylase-like protein